MYIIRYIVFKRKRRTISDSPLLRCGRGSNPRPLAWQASILTNWTTAPKLVAPFGLRVQRYDVFPKLPNVLQRKLKLFFIMPNFPSSGPWGHRGFCLSDTSISRANRFCSCYLWANLHAYICCLGNFYYLCPWIPSLQRWCEEGSYRKRCYWNYLLKSNFATLIMERRW